MTVFLIIWFVLGVFPAWCLFDEQLKDVGLVTAKDIVLAGLMVWFGMFSFIMFLAYIVNEKGDDIVIYRKKDENK